MDKPPTAPNGHQKRSTPDPRLATRAASAQTRPARHNRTESHCASALIHLFHAPLALDNTNTIHSHEEWRLMWRSSYTTLAASAFVLLKVYAHHLEQTDRKISAAVAALVPKPRSRTA
jgi:hypothetical protein